MPAAKLGSGLLQRIHASTSPSTWKLQRHLFARLDCFIFFAPQLTDALPGAHEGILHPDEEENADKKRSGQEPPRHHPETHRALDGNIACPIIIDEEHSGRVLPPAELGGVLPVPGELQFWIPLLVENRLLVFDSLGIDRKPVFPLGSKEAIGIWKETPLLGIDLKQSDVLVFAPLNKKIPSGSDVDVPSVPELHAEGDGEKFVDGLVGGEVGDDDFAFGIRDPRFEEDEGGRAANHDRFPGFGFDSNPFIGSGKDEGIIVAERSGFGDGEGGSNGFPLFGSERESGFGKSNPAEEVVARFGIEDLGSARFAERFEFVDVDFDGFLSKTGVFYLEFSGNGRSRSGDEGNGERGSDETEFAGLGGGGRYEVYSIQY